MIKTLTGGKYIQVTGGSMHPYISPGSQSAGMIRYNVNSNNLEVYDGVAWKELAGGYTSVELTAEAQELLDYVREKKQKEKRLDELMEKHPGLRDLHDRFEVMLALVQATKDA